MNIRILDYTTVVDYLFNNKVKANIELFPDDHQEYLELMDKVDLGELFNIKRFVSGRNALPEIKNVYFNNSVTVVLWNDGTKTIVKCQKGDTYSKETGLALCISKKALGNKGNFNDIFKKWIPEEKISASKDDHSSKKDPYRGCVTCKHIYYSDSCQGCQAVYDACHKWSGNSHWEPEE